MATLNKADNSPTEKAEVEHFEDKAPFDYAPGNVDTSRGLLKSRFDELSLLRTLWLFRRAAIYCVLVYTGYLCEGFELTAGGSIIANAGFIKQFGSQSGTGVRKLDKTWGDWVPHQWGTTE